MAAAVQPQPASYNTSRPSMAEHGGRRTEAAGETRRRTHFTYRHLRHHSTPNHTGHYTPQHLSSGLLDYTQLTLSLLTEALHNTFLPGPVPAAEWLSGRAGRVASLRRAPSPAFPLPHRPRSGLPLPPPRSPPQPPPPPRSARRLAGCWLAGRAPSASRRVGRRVGGVRGERRGACNATAGRRRAVA